MKKAKRVGFDFEGNKNLIILSVFVLIVSFLVGYNAQFDKSIKLISGYATVTDVGSKYLGDGTESPLTTNSYGTIKNLPSGLANKLLYPTGFSHSIGGIPEVVIWDIDGNYFTTTNGQNWNGPYQLKKADGSIIKPVVAYSHKVGGEWIVLWDSNGNYYSTNGKDLNGNYISDWRTNINAWRSGTSTTAGLPSNIKPTLGYRHNIDPYGRNWAVIWQTNSYYAIVDGSTTWASGTFSGLFGNFAVGRKQIPNAEYSHNLGGSWVILWTGDGRFYSTKDAQNWNSGTLTNYYGSNLLSATNYNPHKGGNIAPVIGFSHRISGIEEIVLIEASGNLFTTKDASYWVFVDYDAGKVWYGPWR